jgi:hypothetical protein
MGGKGMNISGSLGIDFPSSVKPIHKKDSEKRQKPDVFSEFLIPN